MITLQGFPAKHWLLIGGEVSNRFLRNYRSDQLHIEMAYSSYEPAYLIGIWSRFDDFPLNTGFGFAERFLTVFSATTAPINFSFDAEIVAQCYCAEFLGSQLTVIQHLEHIIGCTTGKKEQQFDA